MFEKCRPGEMRVPDLSAESRTHLSSTPHVLIIMHEQTANYVNVFNTQYFMSKHLEVLTVLYYSIAHEYFNH